jgi:hypothetical protein
MRSLWLTIFDRIDDQERLEARLQKTALKTGLKTKSEKNNLCEKLIPHQGLQPMAPSALLPVIHLFPSNISSSSDKALPNKTTKMAPKNSTKKKKESRTRRPNSLDKSNTAKDGWVYVMVGIVDQRPTCNTPWQSKKSTPKTSRRCILAVPHRYQQSVDWSRQGVSQMWCKTMWRAAPQGTLGNFDAKDGMGNRCTTKNGTQRHVSSYRTTVKALAHIHGMAAKKKS